MTTRKLLRAGVVTVATLLGLALLASPTTSYADWYDVATVEGTTMSTGTLALAKGTPTVAVAGTRSATTSGLSAGDRITFTAPVRIHAVGDLLTASLTLDASAAFPSLQVGQPSVRDSRGNALPATGRNTWEVTQALDGETLTATIVATVPATARPGAAYGAGELRWHLAQDGLGGSGWRSVVTHPTPIVTVGPKLDLKVTPGATSAVVENTTAEPLTWRVAGVRVLAERGDHSALDGTTVTYRVLPTVNATCPAGSLAWSATVDGSDDVVVPAGADRAFAAGASAKICIETEVGSSIWRLAGQTVTVVTELAATQGMQTVSKTWTTTYRVSSWWWLVWWLEPVDSAATTLAPDQSAAPKARASTPLAAPEVIPAPQATVAPVAPAPSPAPSPDADGQQDTAPDVEQSTDEQPASDRPADEEPTHEQPVDRQPALEQPAHPQPSSDGPRDEQATHEQPAPEQPAGQQPGSGGSIDEQASNQPPADEPPVDEQSTHERSADAGATATLLPDGVVEIAWDRADVDDAATWQVLGLDETGAAAPLTDLLPATNRTTRLAVAVPAGDRLTVRIHLTGTDELVRVDVVRLDGGDRTRDEPTGTAGATS
ncbi:hypothetical protein [Georgenia subflava]|uniref:Uncharacterized protein n=1 Tax=Georgenia subflava TaxID=1622177 RepID=A0A6N7EGE5_9MICO|nr:hypothetical protein [Georgenia subflava]MPV36243.1 hypothetical protein [Georgenia subflava]